MILSEKTLATQTDEEIIQELDFLSEILWTGFTRKLKDTLEFVEKNKETLRHTTTEELTNILLTQ